jgi:hypothetical protein
MSRKVPREYYVYFCGRCGVLFEILVDEVAKEFWHWVYEVLTYHGGSEGIDGVVAVVVHDLHNDSWGHGYNVLMSLGEV